MKNLIVDKPVDNNLKPIKDSDGTLTGLEISTDNTRVKNLETTKNLTVREEAFITGNLYLDADKKVIFGDTGEYISGDGEQLDIASSLDLDMTAGRDMDLVSGRVILLDAANEIHLDSALGIFKFLDAGDTDDAFKITVVGGTGQTTLGTISAGDDGHLIIDADGDLVLDSNSGNFIAKKAGTEFSAANSAYAGMILGYTALGADAATATYSVTNAYVTVSSDHKVAFVAPPSGKVEIVVSIFADGSTGRPLFFGLSDNATYNTLDVTHEHHVATIDETDEKEINHSWVITGLTAGSSYTYYLGAKSTHNSVYVLEWGGDATGEYAPFIMKATALPETITT